MEQYSNVLKANMVATSRTVVLDYLFGQGDAMDAYQLVRFEECGSWSVLYNGYLMANLYKADKSWISVDGGSLDNRKVASIGRFIDSQHFNLLPDKIKTHWEEQVQEVIMENDSSYMVVCRDGIEFSRFRLMFSSFISELVEEEWPVSFRVYNALFSDDFEIEVSPAPWKKTIHKYQ